MNAAFHEQSELDGPAIRATNAFYIILDLISACLAFLTSRWFQRLTNAEKDFLQKVFAARARETSEQADLHCRKPAPKPSMEREDGDPLQSTPLSGIDKLAIPWYSMSLFVPMLLLVLGPMCMLAGLYTYTWSQHPLPVAIVVSFTGLVTVPFITGVFSIGRVSGRRKNIILRLSRMQGDW
ncbi:hypothetical protein BU17DRAFT_50071 [Hysterangium stoloniferum]|nr:hypothetical protein BU17DRAFT_50071 [Hysterangium stoloniferum]